MTTIDLAAETARILAVIEAGAEARCYVQGAMDPAYADPAARDREARDLARVSPTLAAAFLAGWSAHRATVPVEPFAWHRWLGGVRIEVAA